MQSTFAITGVEEPLRRFLGWWSAELMSLVPQQLLARLARPRRGLVLDLSAGSVQLIRSGREGWELIDAADRGDTASMAALGQAARELAARTRTPVVLRLPRESCLLRTLELPAVGRERLAAMLAIDAAWLLPDQADAVVSAWTSSPLPGGPGRLAVEHAIARRSAIGDALAAAAARGIEPSAIDCWRDGRTAVGIDLLAAFRADAAPPRMALSRAMLAAAVLLALASPVAVLVRNETVLVELDLRIAESRSSALAAREAQQRHEGANDIALLWLERRRGRARAAELWLEATRLLPDDAFAEELSIDGASLAIEGQAKAAADLIPLIERSDLFSDVAFSSAVVLDHETSRERFSLEARLQGGSAP